MAAHLTKAERPSALGGESDAATEPKGPGAHRIEELSEVGPYRITGRAGAGGMGIVYRAVHRTTGVEAALKTVRVIDLSLLSSLRREVRALSRLRHPGIVQIYEVGLHDATPWYAMELLSGSTLRRRMRGETVSSDDEQTQAEVSGARPRARTPGIPPSPERRIELLATTPVLCDALAFLHGEGVIHLDLKPDNVFVSGARVVLMDFGLAARTVQVHGRELLDVVGRGMGTVSYIAPEQVRGDRLDARADLYALGCVLFEIVAGEPPFVADSSMAVAFCHLEIPAAPLRERVPDVDPRLDELVAALLEKRPEDRPGYATDVARELRAILGDAAPEPDPSAPAPRDYLYRPPVVGREGPLETLRAALERAKQGATELVMLGGESGVGKTRLASEVARSEAGGQLTVLAGECTSAGVGEAHGAPLAPLAEVFHTIADRCRQRGPEETRALLGAHGPVLSPFAPELRDLPGAEAWAEPAPLPARAARARLVRAAADAVLSLARSSAVALLVDDVHWADDLTLEVLLTLANEAKSASAPLLIVTTHRSDEATPALDTLARVEGVTSISLGRLDAQGAKAMVDGMLGAAPLPDAMVERVSEHAEGNPFFIAEYLRAAVRERVLVREQGRWTTNDEDGTRAAALPMPGSILELVRRRLERLSPLARAVAEVAAVLGRDMAPDALSAHVHASEAEIADALLELVATQMHEPLEDGRLRFVHAKLHEGVYASLDPSRRRALHAAVADALLEAPPRVGRHALLAHHLLAAGAQERAIDALEAAGLEALASGSHSAAEAFFERAASCATQAEAQVPALRRARWERGLGDARFALGDLGAAAVHGRAALALLGHSLPESALGAGWSVLREGTVAALTRPATGDEAEALTEAALAALRVAEAGYYQLEAASLLGGSVLATTLAGRAGAEVQAAKAYAMLGVVLGSLGLRGPSMNLCDRAVRGAEAGSDAAGLAFTLYAKATNALCHCDFEGARQAAARASSLARSVGDEYDAGVAETILGHCEYWTGELAASVSRYRDLARTSRAVRATQHEAWGLYAEARTLVHTGECGRAVALCRMAKEKLVGQNDAASELICEGLLAWALIGDGDEDEALLTQAHEAATRASDKIRASKAAIFANIPGYAGTIEAWLALAPREPRALALAREAHKPLSGLTLGTPLSQSSSRYYAGRIALAQGKRGRACAELSRAAAIASEHGMRLDEGLARLWLGRALEGEAAASERARGEDLLARIGAHRYLKG